MKKIIVLLIGVLVTLTSCQSFNHWLFDASDYHPLRDNHTEIQSDTTNINLDDMQWDNFDFDGWMEEDDVEL